MSNQAENDQRATAAYQAYCEQEIAQIVPRLHSGGWATYDTRRPEFAELKAAGEKWVAEFVPGKSRGIRFCGVVGCGKTRVGYAIVEAVIRRGMANGMRRLPRVSAINTADLFAQIRLCWDSREHSEDALFEDLLDNDLLFLDDLGVESSREKVVRDYVLDRLYLLLDRAQRAMTPTLIVSSNMGLDRLRKFYGAGNGERIISRLEQMTELFGKFPKADLRRRGGLKNAGMASEILPVDGRI